ncbi:histidinol-phosphate transaminase [Kaistella montana]|uniref:Histidinol-phosphate aminotransferase n=1 Tax=Kaistella montana TaxID=1849733 RepID=A0ABW5K648_9FLAO|nr:histidinol-phosphate transaminase [Kaistella montana]MCQ4034603.1 histidinol-phosphate transaminase [Kaistella montana]
MKSKIEELVRKNIRNLAPYSSARDEYSGKEGIFLDANENPFGIYNRYPDPYQPALKQKLAELKNTNPENIFIGNGSDEVIDLAFRIFCEPRLDKALTFVPTYGMYEVSANINDVELIKLPLNTNFQIERKDLEPYFLDEFLKLIFICSPNNPTGNLLKIEDIEFILENFNGIVIIDEAYIDFCEQPSFIEKIAKYPNLIIIQTLSKAWGMAGIRLGIGVMNEEILSYYNRVKAPYNISVINQKTALEILNNEEKFHQKVKDILIEKQQLIEKLSALKIIKKIFPSNANFLLVEVENADEIYEKLIQKKIIVRNRNSVIKNCMRISVGTPEENEALLNALKEQKND